MRTRRKSRCKSLIIPLEFSFHREGQTSLAAKPGEEYSGAARFLRHFSKSDCDYLQIQQRLFKGMRLDQIYKKASEHYSGK